MTIEAYLEAIKGNDAIQWSPASTMRERSTLIDGYLRARLALVDDSQLEFSEYMQRSPTGEIAVITYVYHWTDAAND